MIYKEIKLKDKYQKDIYCNNLMRGFTFAIVIGFKSYKITRFQTLEFFDSHIRLGSPSPHSNRD